MSYGVELGLTPNGVKVIGYFRCVKLLSIVKNHGARDAEAGYDIFTNKFLDFGCGNGGYSLNFYPLGEVICRDKMVLVVKKMVLVLTCGRGERFEYVHAPCSKG